MIGKVVCYTAVLVTSHNARKGCVADYGESGSRKFARVLRGLGRERRDQFRFLGNCPPTPPLLTSHLGQNDGLGKG